MFDIHLSTEVPLSATRARSLNSTKPYHRELPKTARMSLTGTTALHKGKVVTVPNYAPRHESIVH